jgi:hypothetical protein
MAGVLVAAVLMAAVLVAAVLVAAVLMAAIPMAAVLMAAVFMAAVLVAGVLMDHFIISVLTPHTTSPPSRQHDLPALPCLSLVSLMPPLTAVIQLRRPVDMDGTR